jgi:hypothetical protein
MLCKIEDVELWCFDVAVGKSIKEIKISRQRHSHSSALPLPQQTRSIPRNATTNDTSSATSSNFPVAATA